VGKSDMMREIARALGLHFLDLRMSLLNPVDLRGVPVAREERIPLLHLRGEHVLHPDGSKVTDENDHYVLYEGGEPVLNTQGEQRYEIKRVTEWWHPSFLPTEPGYLILLDELNAAPNSVQAAAYQLVLDGRVGEYVLPDDCYVVACGNRDTDRAIVNPMSSALANRFAHLELMPNLKDWKKWALNSDIDHRVVSFLNFSPDDLFRFDPAKHKKAFCTPRSWAMVSGWLSLTGGDVDAALNLINGSVGSGAGTKFSAFCAVMDDMPNPAPVILEGKFDVDMPTRTDVAYAFVGGLANVVRKQTKRDKIVLGFENYCKYAVEKMSRVPELAATGVSDIFVMPFFRAAGAHLAYNSRDYMSFEKAYGHFVRAGDYLSPDEQKLENDVGNTDEIV